MMQKLAGAVHYLHTMAEEDGSVVKILHRDLKPGNVLMQSEDHPKITDFGLAKSISQEEVQRHTSTGRMRGTPAYMSPEQAQGRPRDYCPQTDVYGLGAILYEMLTGCPPFQRDENIKVLLDVIQTPPISPKQLVQSQPSHALVREKVPRDLETICLKCLEKKPQRRYESAEDLQKDLQRYVRGEPIKARPLNRVTTVLRWVGRNQVPTLVMTVLAVIVIGLVIGLYLDKRKTLAEEASIQIEKARDEASRQRDAKELARREAASLNARLIFDSGTVALRYGDLDHGLLLYAHSLKPLPPESGLQRNEILSALALHYPKLHTLEDVAGNLGMLRCLSIDDAQDLVAIGSDDQIIWVYDIVKTEGKRHFNKRLRISLGPPDSKDPDKPYSVAALAFRPDGKELLAATNNGNVYSINPITGKINTLNDRPNEELNPLFSYSGRPQWVSYSQDAKTVLVAGMANSKQAGSSPLVLYRAGSGQKVTSLPSEKALYAAAFSPANKDLIATAGRDNLVQLWTHSNARLVSTGQRMLHPGPVFALAFHPKGHLVASGCVDGRVRLWDVSSGKLLMPPLRHDAQVRSVQFSPDGQLLLTSSENGVAKCWDLRNVPNSIRMLGQRIRHLDQIRGLGVTKEGEVLTAGFDGSIKLWRVSTGNSNVRALHHQAIVWDAAFSRDGSTILTSTLNPPASLHPSGGAYLWDVQGGMLRQQPFYQHEPTRKSPVESLIVQFHPGDSSRFFSTGNDGRVLLWQDTHTLLHQFAHKSTKVVLTATYSQPNGRYLAFGGVGKEKVPVVLCSASSGKIIRVIPHNAPAVIWCVDFNHDETRLVSAGGKQARLWSIPDGKLLASFQHEDEVKKAVFSPDGQFVLTCSFDKTAKLWSALNGELIWKASHLGSVTDGIFSKDGLMVVTSSTDGTIRLWDNNTGKPLKGHVLQHDSPVECLDLYTTAAHQHIVAGCHDGSVRLWKMSEEAHWGTTMFHEGPVTRVRFSQNGRYLLTASRDQTAKIWNVHVPNPFVGSSPQKLIERLERDSGIRIVSADSKKNRILYGPPQPLSPDIWHRLQIGETLRPGNLRLFQK